MPEKPVNKNVGIIACIGPNYELGYQGNLIYHIKGDMYHFRTITGFDTVIMGRKTWESLPDKTRPLPYRENIVITRDPNYDAPDAIVCGSLEEAIEHAKNENIWIIGGGQIYKEAMDKGLATLLYMTHCSRKADKCDTFFPLIDPEKWVSFSASPLLVDEKDPGLKYQFINWKLKN